MITFGRRVYGREELLLLGRSVLCSETTYRVPTSAWLNIKHLGVATANDTKRGTRGGKIKNSKTEELVTEQPVNKSISDRSKLTAATLNCRSVCNKSIDIHDYIVEKELDFICF